MKAVTVQTTIAADPDRVFAVLVDIERFPETSPDTVAVEFMGEQRSGAGTRFRETRQMGGQTQDFELELKACDPTQRTARFVSDMQGTVWDTHAEVVDAGAKESTVRFTMAAHTSSRFRSFVLGLMRGMFKKAMTKQVEALKAHCEAVAA